MMTLMQFEISVQNKPGEIARIAELLGRNSVNIQGISTELNAKNGYIKVITDDEATTRRSLKVGGLDFLEREVLEISLPDRPGELAKMTKTLARAGINIESLFIIGSGTAFEKVALGVNDMDKTKEVLWKYLV
jgi:hypothetical protein